MTVEGQNHDSRGLKKIEARESFRRSVPKRSRSIPVEGIVGMAPRIRPDSPPLRGNGNPWPVRRGEGPPSFDPFDVPELSSPAPQLVAHVLGETRTSTPSSTASACRVNHLNKPVCQKLLTDIARKHRRSLGSERVVPPIALVLLAVIALMAPIGLGLGIGPQAWRPSPEAADAGGDAP